MEINIEGLDSLETIFLRLHEADAYSFSIRNLNSLKCLCLKTSGVIDESLLKVFLDKIPNIEELYLHGNFSYFNLDKLSNLKALGLTGTIKDDFNFELFKNLCNQLQELAISCWNDYESIGDKLFDAHHFPHMQELKIYKCNVKRVKKKFIDKFPALLYLNMYECNLEMIEDGAFSNNKQLLHLFLMNNFLKTLEKQSFSQLTNLEAINLSNNRLETIEKDIFSNLKNLRTLDLSDNNLLQLDYETFNRLKKLDGFSFE